MCYNPAARFLTTVHTSACTCHERVRGVITPPHPPRRRRHNPPTFPPQTPVPLVSCHERVHLCVLIPAAPSAPAPAHAPDPPAAAAAAATTFCSSPMNARASRGVACLMTRTYSVPISAEIPKGANTDTMRCRAKSSQHQGRTLVHFSVLRKRFLWNRECI